MTWEEFKKGRTATINMSPYSETDIECPICGKPIYVDNQFVLASNPPQKKYICLDCGWVGTSF